VGRGDVPRKGQPVTADADVVVVGAGLAGLVATAELADTGRRVIVVDQEPEASLGGQAFWSLGGLFLVDSPEQRRFGIHDSHELALQDWMGTAAFDRKEDLWPRRWAEAYVAFAAGEKRAWLRALGLRLFPIVGWAERGGYGGDRPRELGATVPHHVGNGPGGGGAVRAARARRRRPRPGHAEVPPPRRRADGDRRRHRRRPRPGPRAERRAGVAPPARASRSASSS